MLTAEGLPKVGEQRMMRELKLVDAIFEVAHVAVRNGWSEHIRNPKSSLNRTTQLALRVLHRACAELPRNEYYLASRHVRPAAPPPSPLLSAATSPPLCPSHDRQVGNDTILAHLTTLVPFKVAGFRPTFSFPPP